MEISDRGGEGCSRVREGRKQGQWRGRGEAERWERKKRERIWRTKRWLSRCCENETKRGRGRKRGAKKSETACEECETSNGARAVESEAVG